MTDQCPDRDCHEVVTTMQKDMKDIRKDMYKRPGGLVFCVKDKVPKHWFFTGLGGFLLVLLFIGNLLFAPKEVKYRQGQILETLQEQKMIIQDIQGTVNKLSRIQDKEGHNRGGN